MSAAPSGGAPANGMVGGATVAVAELRITAGPGKGLTCDVVGYEFNGDVIVRPHDGRAPLTVPRTRLEITLTPATQGDHP